MRREYGRFRDGGMGRGRRPQQRPSYGDAEPEQESEDFKRAPRTSFGTGTRGRGGMERPMGRGRGGEQPSPKDQGFRTDRRISDVDNDEDFPRLQGPPNQRQVRPAPAAAVDADIGKSPAKDAAARTGGERPSLRSKLEASAGRGGIAPTQPIARGRGGAVVARQAGQVSPAAVPGQRTVSASGRIVAARSVDDEQDDDSGAWQPPFKSQGVGSRGGMRTVQAGGRGGGRGGGNATHNQMERPGGEQPKQMSLSEIFAAQEEVRQGGGNVLPERNVNRPSARRARGGESNGSPATSFSTNAPPFEGGGHGAAPNIALQPQFIQATASAAPPGVGIPGPGVAVAGSGQWTQDTYAAWTPAQYATAGTFYKLLLCKTLWWCR